jgi:hypothetical protein
MTPFLPYYQAMMAKPSDCVELDLQAFLGCLAIFSTRLRDIFELRRLDFFSYLHQV